jgi:hypothetical protein
VAPHRSCFVLSHSLLFPDAGGSRRGAASLLFRVESFVVVRCGLRRPLKCPLRSSDYVKWAFCRRCLAVCLCRAGMMLMLVLF